MRICIALVLLSLVPLAARAQVPDAALAALVKITAHRAGEKWSGSGFVVGLEPGRVTIVTAAHVIEGIDSFEVLFAADPSESVPGDRVLGLAGGDPNGLAVVQVRGSIPAAVTVLPFELERKLRLGDALYLLGFPTNSVAVRTIQGVFSGRDGSLLLADRKVEEGFSGGPMLQEGKAVGVIGSTPDQQTTIAVSALVVRGALEGWGIKLGATTAPPVRSSNSPTKPPQPGSARCSPGKELTENGITYVRICAGAFTMGSAANAPQSFPDEKPAHLVTLSEFWIGKTEVTNGQYRRFRPDHSGQAMLPMIEISWQEAKAACESFGGRLPTEAEWEYAARAGSGAAWTFGDDEEQLGEYGWYGEKANGRAYLVGTKRPNRWGLFDMHGNAWEWVADWYGAYPSAAQTDPQGPATGTHRVQRGGGLHDPAWVLRSAYRDFYEPTFRVSDIGFRCARDPSDQP